MATTVTDPVPVPATASSNDAVHLCDRCHMRVGLAFIDCFWCCARCAGHYRNKIQWERWRS